MKKLQWFIMVVLTVMTMAVSAGCSNNDEPQYELIPEYDGKSLIQNGKIYIYLYAPKGMKYAPVEEKYLPDCVTKTYLNKMLKDIILFEGIHEGRTIYWIHYIGSSSLTPKQLSEDGYPTDINLQYFELNYTKLKCIYIGDRYLEWEL